MKEMIHTKSIKVVIVCMLLYLITPLNADIPWLHVDGNKIKDPDGNVVVLRGISLIDLGFLEGWQGGAINMIDRLTDKNDSQGSSPGWYPKVLRIPVHPPDSVDGWPHRWDPDDDSFYNDLLRPVVDYCADKDLYVIIDWHYITDTWDKVVQTSDFWRYMAPRFANDSHVLFELFNEPINRIGSDRDNWLSVRTDMQTWVDIVRTYARNNLILVAGPSWSQGIGPAASYPLSGSNIVIVSHIYPSHWRNPSWYRNHIRTCAAVYPILMTEWGFSQSNHPDPDDLLHGTITDYGQPLMDFIEGLKIGNTAWVASYNWGPPMFWNDWTLRCGEGEMGCFVKDALYEKRNDDQPYGEVQTPADLGSLSTEDFETNDFSKFPWRSSGDASWRTTRQERHSGSYCAESGSIEGDESTTLQVTLDCTSGNITFYRKVSSEAGYDYLKFHINGVEKDKWSGEEDWAEVSFPVAAGTRTFEWTYSKDGSASEGDDTAWIDDIVFPCRVQSIESSLVHEGVDGHLVYETYANEGQTNSVNTIPDFSHCGYMGGGVAIPDVPVAITLFPENGDDTEAIQDAIDYVSSLSADANGFRGAVLLTAGRYQVSSSLTITAGGVVLRGQGQDVLGTVLEATGAYDYDVINVKGSGGYSTISSTIRLITSPYVPVGAYSFDVENTNGYSVGDWIIVQRTPNQLWIDDLAMGQYGWTPGSYSHKYERYVVDITGNTITIDSPIVEAIQDKYGGGRICRSSPLSRLKQCGVENLRIESTYAGDTDENHPWDAVVLQDVEDCWVRRVTAQFFAYSCVKVASESTRATIEDCAFLDPKSVITGGRRYAFAINAKANHILFQRCYAADARHSYVTGARVPGPNVFVDCYAYDCWNDSGPHHRWAVGTLFDNVYDSKEINVQNRGPSGTGHGWAGAQQVLWNCEAGSIICEAPEGAMNFAIGCSGTRKNGKWINEPDGWWEHQWQRVSPRSLYYKQLEDRLGMAAVENVTTPEQRSGSIWSDLAEWGGLL